MSQMSHLSTLPSRTAPDLRYTRLKEHSSNITQRRDNLCPRGGAEWGGRRVHMQPILVGAPGRSSDFGPFGPVRHTAREGAASSSGGRAECEYREGQSRAEAVNGGNKIRNTTVADGWGGKLNEAGEGESCHPLGGHAPRPHRRREATRSSPRVSTAERKHAKHPAAAALGHAQARDQDEGASPPIELGLGRLGGLSAARARLLPGLVRRPVMSQGPNQGPAAPRRHTGLRRP